MTRWNSQLKMLKMLRRVDEILKLIPTSKINVMPATKLKASDIRVLQELQSFEDATDVLQGENATTSFLFPCIVGKNKRRLTELENEGDILHVKQKHSKSFC